MRCAQASRYVQENSNSFFTPHVIIKITEDQVKTNQHIITAFNIQRGIYEVLTRRARAELRGGENSQIMTLSDKIFL